MQNLLSRWLLFGLLCAWALSHATVFGQQTGKPVGTDKVRQGLEKPLTLDYAGQSFAEVLNHIREKSGVTINIDQFTLMQMGMNPDDNVGPMNVKAANEKTSVVLRKLLSPFRLTYVVFEDTVLVTTEEAAIFRQMRHRVSVDLEDVPFKKAIRDLTKTHGINLVIDPRVNKQVDTPVSLQLENVGVETTIRLLAEMANLKAVRMGNVMFVTSEDRAKKIREEEQHQFDNPLNPNVPGGCPAVIGGFGGIAMPARPAIGIQGNAVPGIALPEPPPPPPGIELPPVRENPVEPKRQRPPQPNIDPAPGAPDAPVIRDRRGPLPPPPPR